MPSYSVSIRECGPGKDNVKFSCILTLMGILGMQPAKSPRSAESGLLRASVVLGLVPPSTARATKTLFVQQVLNPRTEKKTHSLYLPVHQCLPTECKRHAVTPQKPREPSPDTLGV